MVPDTGADIGVLLGVGITIIITIHIMDGAVATGEVVMADGLDLIPIIMTEITFMVVVEGQV